MLSSPLQNSYFLIKTVNVLTVFSFCAMFEAKKEYFLFQAP
jgi:hypothetical protein